MRKFKPRYIGKKISKLPYISDIFQRDRNGFYTKDALMYQDILQFSDDKASFTRSEVDNWLLRNNQELINDYKDLSTRNMRYSTRRANKKDRLDRIFNNAVNLKVIVCSGTTTAKKLKNMDIETYSIDKSGKLILEIIKYMSLKELSVTQKGELSSDQMKTKELEISISNAYELIMSIFVANEEIPYQSIVFKEFLNKLQVRKLFFKFVDHAILIFGLNHYIRNISHLMHIVLNFMFNQANERNLFMDLYYESANGLSPEGKTIFLYERKLEIEENFKNNIKGYSREYEKQCFVERANYNIIVLEGECNECKEFNVVKLSHNEYFRLIRDANVFGVKQGSIQKFDCEHCQSKDSCLLSTF